MDTSWITVEDYNPITSETLAKNVDVSMYDM